MTKKISLGIILVALAALLYFFVVQPWLGAPAERVVANELVENDAYALSFNYLTGDDGYELISSATSDNFLQSYVLVEKAALAEFQSAEADEVPPTMSIFIFTLPEEEVDEATTGRISRLQTWAQTNAGLTAYDQIYGTPEIIQIDGVKALEYTTDGRYQQSVFLASYRGLIYMFVGQYDRPTDFIKQDFETLVTSVRFE